MGKRLLVQRRGRGSPTFRAVSRGKKGAIKHPSVARYRGDSLEAEIINLEHERGRGAPIARIQYTDGTRAYMIAPEGVAIGESIKIGVPEIKIGNTLPLKDIPEGTSIYNIESQPGDGGKFVRASGTYATIVTRDPKKVIIKLPSGQSKAYNPECRASIGIVAGGGRTEKPFTKAGNKYFFTRSRHIKWPKVRGVAMNAASHPHGGGSHQHIGKKSSCVSRDAPPGRKVGLIAARRTGRKKR